MCATLLILANVYAINIVEAYDADLAFGRAQVEQVMRDRPDMAPIITSNKALREFLETNFAGVETGHRVRWDDTKPTLVDRPAETQPRYEGQLTAIRVCTDPSYSGVDKCAMMVFELHNAKSVSRAKAILKEVYSGRMSRDDYSKSCTHLEFESGRKTRDFFRQHPLVPSSPDDNWVYQNVLSQSDDFSAALNSSKGFGGAYLLQYYRECYDRIMGARKDTDMTTADLQERDEDTYNRMMANAKAWAEKVPDVPKQEEVNLDEIMSFIEQFSGPVFEVPKSNQSEADEGSYNILITPPTDATGTNSDGPK